jgi:hypothetical protein
VGVDGVFFLSCLPACKHALDCVSHQNITRTKKWSSKNKYRRSAGLSGRCWRTRTSKDSRESRRNRRQSVCR